MKSKLFLALFAALSASFILLGTAYAQSPTPSPQVPSGAPNTGYGYGCIHVK